MTKEMFDASENSNDVDEGDESDASVFAAAQALAVRYRKEVDGHHARRRAFLQDICALAPGFKKHAAAWEKLVADPFWNDEPRAPSKWFDFRDLLLFVTRPKSHNDRSQAGTDAIVLEFVFGLSIPFKRISQWLREAGGVDAVHQMALDLERRQEFAVANPAATDGCGPYIPSPAGPYGYLGAGMWAAEVARASLDREDVPEPADWEAAYLKRIREVVSNPSAFALPNAPTESVSKKRFEVRSSLIIEAGEDVVERQIADVTPESKPRRIVLEVEVSARDPSTGWVPMKLIRFIS
jgi:hypothetical protein